MDVNASPANDRFEFLAEIVQDPFKARILFNGSSVPLGNTGSSVETRTDATVLHGGFDHEACFPFAYPLKKKISLAERFGVQRLLGRTRKDSTVRHLGVEREVGMATSEIEGNSGEWTRRQWPLYGR